MSDAAQERFLRLPEVMHLCGLSRSTVYDLISRGDFGNILSAWTKHFGQWTIMAEQVSDKTIEYRALNFLYIKEHFDVVEISGMLAI